MRALLLLAFLAAMVPRAYAALIPQPIMQPPGDSGWVGSTSFTFSSVSTLTGKIMYTLDGSAPQKDVKGSTHRYTPGTVVLVESTLTVRAIEVVGGSASSEASFDFVRAQVPRPVAHYGGNAHFYPALACSLSVGATQSAATLRYTLNDSALGPTSTAYAGKPLQFSNSTVLRAYATAAGYDDSKPLQVDFVLDQVATPSIDPVPGGFKTPTLTVHMKSATAGAHIRYTIDPTLSQPEKWTLMTGDSVTFPAIRDGDSIQLRAQAFVSAYQTSSIQSAKYFYLPAVLTPVFNPGPKIFYDTLTVKMTSNTTGASVRYTDDGSTPTSTSLDGSVPVLLKKSDTLKAKAFKDKHDPSAVATAAYIMNLSQPTSDKPNGEFTGTLNLHLHAANPNAAIFYSLDGVAPVLQTSGSVANGSRLTDSAGTITLSQDGTTVVTAIAVAAGVSSQPAQFTYTRKTTITAFSTPAIEPVSRDFFDTLSIRMTTPDSDAEIRYTLTAAGRDPTRQDSLAVSGRAILLDSSAVLRCRAFPRPNSQSTLLESGVNEMKYVLRPSQPAAVPQSNGDPVPAGTLVTLKSHTKGGIIHYATDPGVDLATTTGFPDSVAIPLNASTTFYAETFLGSGAGLSVSSLLVAHYDVVVTAPSDTLPVNGIRPISGGFAYQNKSPQAVLARVRTADGMAITGFSDLSLVVSLQAMDPGQTLKVVFTKPAGTKVSLYRYAGGIVEYVPGKDTVTITLPGDYFTAVDIAPPVISIERQTPQEGDSTTVRIKIIDNVANPTCEIASSGLKGGTTTRKPDAGGFVNVNLKGDGSEPKPIWLRVVSRDAYDSTHLPRDPEGKIYVAQLFPKLATPDVFVIGQGVGPELWDLAGLPIGAGPGMKWADLRGANPDMQACVWRHDGIDTLGHYDSLDDSDHIVQGMAFWVGSRARHSNLNVPALQTTESEGDGTYHIRLTPGWNQVSSPYLDTVYWPITPAVSQAGTTTLKAPYRYARNTKGKWHETDTLAPWIGYFVNFFGSADTVITVYSTASARSLSKAGAGPGEIAAAKAAVDAFPAASIGLVFSAEGLPSLRLGARAGAHDAVGPEDEPRPPAWGRTSSIWSRRGTGSLLTDWVPLKPEDVARWQVVVDPGESGIGDLRVAQAELPPGYEAWAISRARGLKFRLSAGSTLPAATGFTDTLSVFAGSSEALAGIGELARAPERLDALDFALEKNHGQGVLRITLPWKGKVEADVWTVSGQRLGNLRAGPLEPGIYRFPLLSITRAETLCLRLRIGSPAGTREFTRLLAP